MNGYFLEQSVGEGGMAEVFKARAHGVSGFERVVAVKRLLPEFANDPAFRARFIDEARIGARLHHPGIVAVTDYYELNGRQHLVMEFVDGPSVEDLVRRGVSGAFITPSIAALIVLEGACAIEYAHAQGVLHRDVSCCNFLVTRHGEVKLADFGLANAQYRVSRTEPGMLAGKIAYLSPERNAGLAATPQDDLYALGVVLGRLISATDPRVRNTPEGVALAALAGRLVVPVAQRLSSASALKAELRRLHVADRAELAAFVQDNPQARKRLPFPSLPRLSAHEFEDVTHSAAPEETTQSASSPFERARLPPAQPAVAAAAVSKGGTYRYWSLLALSLLLALIVYHLARPPTSTRAPTSRTASETDAARRLDTSTQ